MPALYAYQKVLAADCCEVYLADVTELMCFYETNKTLLSAQEKEKALSFKKQSDTFAYIIRHGLLRFILGERLAIKPESVNIRYRQDGRPFLDPDGNSENIAFSMSSSKDKIAIAIGENISVGVDIQFREPMADCLCIAQRFFSFEEYEYIRDVPEDELMSAFYDCWVCKEAFIKAAGIAPPESFTVTFWREHPELLGSSSPAHLKSKWFFQRFDSGEDYSGMIVKEV